MYVISHYNLQENILVPNNFDTWMLYVRCFISFKLSSIVTHASMRMANIFYTKKCVTYRCDLRLESGVWRQIDLFDRVLRLRGYGRRTYFFLCKTWSFCYYFDSFFFFSYPVQSSLAAATATRTKLNIGNWNAWNVFFLSLQILSYDVALFAVAWILRRKSLLDSRLK